MYNSKRTILITGGAGFIGTNAALYFSKQGWKVIVYDNLSRADMLGKERAFTLNWDHLSTIGGIDLIKGDVLDFGSLVSAVREVDAVIHTAGQTAVTTSMVDPEIDFQTNTCGTFNVLEACRLSERKPAMIYCSTNKVYGSKVNEIGIREEESSYSFDDGRFREGIPETFGVDLCEHTPYGCSKLSGDLYVQDYARVYGLKTGVFRMSCIYGPWQFGVEDQGWVAWFTMATLFDKEITIYGDGKQVRDVLYVGDLVRLFERFLESPLNHGVWNTGGGISNTISLLELLEMLENSTGKTPKVGYSSWRPGDQKVYVSDIRKLSSELGWKPTVSIDDGLLRMIEWMEANREVLRQV